MSITAPPPKPVTPVLPPEERFWDRYSRQREFPISWVSALVIVGGTIALMIIIGLEIFRFAGPTGPSNMDAVQVAGGGDGDEGASGEAGLPGAKDALGTEIIQDLSKQTENLPDLGPQAKEDMPAYETPSLGDPPTDLTDETQNELANIEMELRRQMNLPVKPAFDPPKKAPPTGVKSSAPGTNNPKGVGGQGGPGVGPGRGKKGLGKGVGGFPGAKTRQQILAERWRFSLSGSPADHARKLAATGLIPVAPNPQQGGGFSEITGLDRRPVRLKAFNMIAYKDSINWRNANPGSMQGLAAELKLPFVPQVVYMFLPKSQEEKFAAEEQRLLERSKRASIDLVAETWFDFQLRGGAFEPVAVGQIYQDGSAFPVGFARPKQ
jgi:hypothetical protein